MSRKMIQMTDPCAQCGATDRYPNRTCKICSRRRQRKYKAKHPPTPTKRQAEKAWRTRNIERILLIRARSRSKRFHVPCTISVDDIVVPESCPILGVRLKKAEGEGPKANSPSLDRIVPGLGYVPGNVRVISHQANTMKNNASQTELVRFAEYILREVYPLTMAHGYDQPPYSSVTEEEYHKLHTAIDHNHPLTDGGDLEVEECAGNICPVR